MPNWVEDLENFQLAALAKRNMKFQNFWELSREEQKKLVMLRKNIMVEEFKEADDAVLDVYDDVDNEKYREHLLKELCDVLYVTIGTAVDLQLNLEDAFSRVHQNNMLKMKNCTIREDGKLVKDKDHPAVYLEDCV